MCVEAIYFFLFLATFTFGYFERPNTFKACSFKERGEWNCDHEL